jgi:hypothetical protein
LYIRRPCGCAAEAGDHEVGGAERGPDHVGAAHVGQVDLEPRAHGQEVSAVDGGAHGVAPGDGFGDDVLAEPAVGAQDRDSR